jgi:hypothetical protein
MTISHRIRRFGFAAIVLGLASCRDDAPTAVKTLPLLPSTSGTASVVIQREPLGSGDNVVFVVRIVGNNLPIAAYQGVVTFSPKALQVLSVSTPSGTGGEYRVVNDRELAAGRIRFAAFAPEAFSSTEAFRFVARLNDTLLAANLAGALDVAGAPSGSAVRRESLLRSDGVHDALTNRLLER